MFRTLASLRPLAAAVVFGTLSGFAGLSVPAASARAQAPVTLNFNSVATPGTDFAFTSNCYRESGFQLTALLASGTALSCNTANTFATSGPTTAMFLNDPTASLIDFTRVGGGAFSMQSLRFASFLGDDEALTLTGNLVGGGQVSQTFSFLGTLPGFQNLSLLGFTGLTSVRLAAVGSYRDATGVLQREPLVLFDDVVVTPAATVPEPTTIALVAGGLLAVGAAARRRRATTPAA